MKIKNSYDKIKLIEFFVRYDPEMVTNVKVKLKIGGSTVEFVYRQIRSIGFKVAM